MVITVIAAFMQNVRSLLQKRLTSQLSVNGAASVRFVYALPVAWLYALWLWQGEPRGINLEFSVYVAIGAMAQIVATACLLQSFSTGNFAVGTAFSKTEAAQAAMVGLLVLNDSVSVAIVCGILISLIGVVMLSGNLRLQDIARPKPAMWWGLAAGAGFALSAIGFRGASLALYEGDFLQRAGLTVMVSVTLQSILMSLYLIAREPGQLAATCRAWRVGIWVGAIGALASVGWFTAMTLKSAAVVRAVGQIELLFTVMTSVWLLREKLKLRELVGMFLVVFGILLLV